MADRVAHLLYLVSLLSLAAVAPAEPAGLSTYTIREGETLFSVARKARIPVETLCAFNEIRDPARVKAGTPLRIPQTYIVRKGDTLFGIARGFSLSVAQILAFNKLAEASSLKAGERLFIPTALAPEKPHGPPAAGASAVGSAAHPNPPQSSAPHQGSMDSRPWPHIGKHEPLVGKIYGLVFHGLRGDKVVSSSSGEVKWVGPYWGWGKTVIIKSDGGLFFLYAGNEELLVNVGDRVVAGSQIARLGVSPQGGDARLYFSIQSKTGGFMDPEVYFSGG